MTSDAARSDESDWISIGYLSRPHGLKGAIFLVADDRRRELGDYSQVRLEGRGEPRVLRIVSSYVSAGQPVLVLEGVGSREEAETLLRARVLVPRGEALEAPGEDEWLVSDLVGCQVTDEAMGPLGEVVAVAGFGAQENLEIRMPGKVETLLLPLIDAFVVEVSIEQKRISVRNAGEFLDGES